MVPWGGRALLSQVAGLEQDLPLLSLLELFDDLRRVRLQVAALLKLQPYMPSMQAINHHQPHGFASSGRRGGMRAAQGHLQRQLGSRSSSYHRLLWIVSRLDADHCHMLHLSWLTALKVCNGYRPGRTCPPTHNTRYIKP